MKINNVIYCHTHIQDDSRWRYFPDFCSSRAPLSVLMISLWGGTRLTVNHSSAYSNWSGCHRVTPSLNRFPHAPWTRSVLFLTWWCHHWHCWTRPGESGPGTCMTATRWMQILFALNPRGGCMRFKQGAGWCGVSSTPGFGPLALTSKRP